MNDDKKQKPILDIFCWKRESEIPPRTHFLGPKKDKKTLFKSKLVQIVLTYWEDVCLFLLHLIKYTELS